MRLNHVVGFLLVCFAFMGIGYCAGADTSDTERAAWRDESRQAIRHAEGRLKVVIDSLVEVGETYKHRADSLSKAAHNMFAKAESAPDTVTAPDTTPSDSVRYWRSQFEHERSQSRNYRAAYLSQMEATAEATQRAVAAEAARDSVITSNEDLKRLLARGVDLSERSECRIAGLIPCPSRGVTGALLFTAGVLVGVELGR